MTRLGMVIDLSKCVGCGACAFACKAENNTRTRGGEQSYNWADFVIRTEGTFPNVKHSVMPVLCNHCTDAPCVKACKAKPNPHKAMYKTPEGITHARPRDVHRLPGLPGSLPVQPAKSWVFPAWTATATA